MWQPKNGFELIYKQCGCNCGKGAVRKDLDFQRSKKVNRNTENRRFKGVGGKDQGRIQELVQGA